MSELRELYQEMILDHGKKPRNFRVPRDANHDAEGYNPLCGDRLHVHLRVRDGVIEDVGFEGRGCAISTASASMMTGAVKGKRLEDVRRLFERFHAMLTGPAEGGETDGAGRALGRLSVFSGVREFPVRVKCATLPWHTLRAALEGSEEPATTE